MRYKEIYELLPEDILAMPLYDGNNRLLLTEGTKLTEKIIKKIHNYGIQGIYVEDELSKGIEINPILSNKFKKKVYEHLRNFNIDKALLDAKKIVEQVKSHDSFYEYINPKTLDNYTYEHSLSVSLYATIVGLACGLNEKELENLSLAGLLHDLGKRCIDSEIVNKPDKLTKEEFDEIKKHSYFGYNMLKDNFEISATVKIGIYEHHENEDGTGYPRQLKSNQIYKFAKIIHIVDVYDALISKRQYKEARPPHEAIKFIVEKTGTMFDENYVDVFLNVIPAYPKGLMVELSNGEKGIVLENYRGFVLRPKIRLLDGREISLKDDKDYQLIEII